jgi:DNA-binding transcriptional MocR family regulator
MDEFFQTGRNFVNHLVDSFWASLPEQTADDLAKCKKDALNGVKSFVDSVIDTEIKWTDRHLENARRMREQYARRADATSAGSQPDAV